MPETRVRKEVEEYNEESKLVEKIGSDFVKRKEKALISLAEGNLSRIEQARLLSDPIEHKKPKICSRCVYAKVVLTVRE